MLRGSSALVARAPETVSLRTTYFACAKSPRRFGSIINEGAPPDQTDDAGYRVAEEMAGKRKPDQAKATAKQTKTNAKNKKQYDKRHQAPGQKIAKGSIAWRTDSSVSRKTSAGKMLPKWNGPFKVVKITATTAHLQNVRTGDVKKGWPLRLLKRGPNVE